MPNPATALVPCLAELLLQPCAPPPSLLLRVEHVFGKEQAGNHRNVLTHGQGSPQPPVDHDDGAGHKYLHSAVQANTPSSWCFRLALSDGQLQIQAVLAKELQSTELLDLRRGDLLGLKDFQIRSASRINGQAGRVVYLGVQDCELVGRDEKFVPELEVEGGFIREEQEEEMTPKHLLPVADETAGTSTTKQASGRRRSSRKHDQKGKQNAERGRARNQRHADGHGDRARNPSGGEESDDEWFGTITVSQADIEKRRQEKLRQIERAPPVKDAAIPRSKSEPRSQLEANMGSMAPKPPTAVRETNIERDLSFNEASDGPVSQTDDDRPKVDHTLSIDEAPDGILSQADVERSSIEHTLPFNETPHGPVSQVDLDRSTVEPDIHADSSVASSQVQPALVPSTAPLHTLYSLLSPPTPLPRRSYACTIFGIVSWVSPSVIYKPNVPFPPKRHIKIHDPSISHRKAGITVAVFMDAKNFMPVIGTVALFRGLVMQRWEDEVILNKYATVPGRPSDSQGQSDDDPAWFVTDEKSLVTNGFHVHGMKSWWEARNTNKVVQPIGGR